MCMGEDGERDAGEVPRNEKWLVTVVTSMVLRKASSAELRFGR